MVCGRGEYIYIYIIAIFHLHFNTYINYSMHVKFILRLYSLHYVCTWGIQHVCNLYFANINYTRHFPFKFMLIYISHIGFRSAKNRYDVRKIRGFFYWVESFLAVPMFPVSSNFINTPKRYDFSKCKVQRKTRFHEASKLGLQFSRNQWHVGTIG